jgi:hypothetical protein
LHTADYCPMNIVPIEGTNSINGIFQFNCENETLTSDIDAEYYGESSRCIESNQDRPYCMRTVCDKQRHKIIVYANNERIICENDGDMMDIPNAGTAGIPVGAKIQCPELNIVCPE